MDFIELVKRRKSVRSYDPAKKVPGEVLERILEAGRLAPSATNSQPWEFLIVSSDDMLGKIRSCYKASWFQSAPHVLVVKGSRSTAWVRSADGYNALETDLTIAMDHMILAATFEGVSTCWIAAFDPERLSAVLNLAEDEEVFAITPLGYPEKEGEGTRPKTRKSFEQVVTYL